MLPLLSKACSSSSQIALLRGESGSGKKYLIYQAAKQYSLNLQEFKAEDLSLKSQWTNFEIALFCKHINGMKNLVVLDQVDKLLSPNLSKKGRKKDTTPMEWLMNFLEKRNDSRLRGNNTLFHHSLIMTSGVAYNSFILKNCQILPEEIVTLSLPSNEAKRRVVLHHCSFLTELEIQSIVSSNSNFHSLINHLRLLCPPKEPDVVDLTDLTDCAEESEINKIIDTTNHSQLIPRKQETSFKRKKLSLTFDALLAHQVCDNSLQRGQHISSAQSMRSKNVKKLECEDSYIGNSIVHRDNIFKILSDLRLHKQRTLAYKQQDSQKKENTQNPETCRIVQMAKNFRHPSLSPSCPATVLFDYWDQIEPFHDVEQVLGMFHVSIPVDAPESQCDAVSESIDLFCDADILRPKRQQPCEEEDEIRKTLQQVAILLAPVYEKINYIEKDKKQEWFWKSQFHSQQDQFCLDDLRDFYSFSRDCSNSLDWVETVWADVHCDKDIRQNLIGWDIFPVYWRGWDTDHQQKHNQGAKRVAMSLLQFNFVDQEPVKAKEKEKCSRQSFDREAEKRKRKVVES